jgi:hypothetical protein
LIFSIDQNATLVADVMRVYPDDGTQKPDARAGAILRDCFFACPSRRVARALSDQVTVLLVLATTLLVAATRRKRSTCTLIESKRTGTMPETVLEKTRICFLQTCCRIFLRFFFTTSSLAACFFSLLTRPLFH